MSLCYKTFVNINQSQPSTALRGRVQAVSRPARPRDIPYAITFWGVAWSEGARGEVRGERGRTNHDVCLLEGAHKS